MKSDEPKIWVTISETINMGNYESVKVEAGYSKSYKADEDPVKLLKDGITELQEVVFKKVKKTKSKRRK